MQKRGGWLPSPNVGNVLAKIREQIYFERCNQQDSAGSQLENDLAHSSPRGSVSCAYERTVQAPVRQSQHKQRGIFRACIDVVLTTKGMNQRAPETEAAFYTHSIKFPQKIRQQRSKLLSSLKCCWSVDLSKSEHFALLPNTRPLPLLFPSVFLHSSTLSAVYLPVPTFPII